MPNKSWLEALRHVKNPLVLFGFALVGGLFITGEVIVRAELESWHRYYLIWGMVGLFALVLIAVSVITIWWPAHWYERAVRELERAKEVRQFIESEGFRDVIADVVEERVKPESLK